ncbi:MAG TPA: alpha-2-macroglobulin family protein, partial [Chitinophagaceae bacterium]|nr:alpha-2-macroglobulin family protein [Chitinophagaceae bacterium]
ISLETFRDKTLPGSQEKWKVKIAGNKKEKLLAEMLTSMYDASLDQFQPHDWRQPNPWPHKFLESGWSGRDEFESLHSIEAMQDRRRQDYVYAEYDRLYAGFTPIRYPDGAYRDMGGYFSMDQLVSSPKTVQVPDWTNDPNGSKGLTKDTIIVNELDVTLPNVVIGPDGKPVQKAKDDQKNAVAVRRNFNETAFFLPQLHTDTLGNIEFSFTMPESVTRWKWMLMAHTKGLSFGYNDTSVITQKELMVQPNLPRFMREGDSMSLVTKVANTGANDMSGEVELQLLDAITNEPVNALFGHDQRGVPFTVPAGQSRAIPFKVNIPYNFTHPLSIRFVARSGNISDGEENAIPVLSNRMLVTETLPLNVRGSGTKNFTFNKLLSSDSSKTLSHSSITLEFTGNPAWYAVQSLPYLIEYPYECAEQTWNRLYANALGASIIDKAPRIKDIFNKWINDSTALLSKLQKNQELRSVLLQETPWVLDAENEAAQHKRIALLFDMAKMGMQLHKTVQQLLQMQMPNGAFAWFRGGDESEYITQYIVSGMGHLKKLGGVPAAEQQLLNRIATRALHYLDIELQKGYDELMRSNADTSKDQLSYSEVQYLYMRSFFPNVQAEDSVALNFYKRQAQKFWLQQSKYMRGMIALALYRSGDQQTAERILRSLKENAIVDEERGMYWKGMEGGYYWYEAPIEIQALMIEAFTDITKDAATVDALKTWLVKNKQTNNWSTTKATAEACYALLLQGANWLNEEPVIEIKLGDKTVKGIEQKTEAGSGYFKKVFDGNAVNSSMGNITVNVAKSTQPSWGAVHWQYFENLDKITSAATPLNLTKKLFVQRGSKLEPVQGKLKTGDKVIVRIELRVDRNMEYIHLKDMRASSLEPVNVLSAYKWQGGLGYYESTKDASTNFFFSYLRKGTYVFEYPLFVTHTGTFSNGITTIQCMYAPEFSSHSEGVKIIVE